MLLVNFAHNFRAGKHLLKVDVRFLFILNWIKQNVYSKSLRPTTCSVWMNKPPFYTVHINYFDIALYFNNAAVECAYVCVCAIPIPYILLTILLFSRCFFAK